ncbi:MAG: Glycerol-3-phosphate O-acyltransferase [Candidatus Magnetoglobus multicellularis str. Araruama]|uniref:Glycerol-3-phosphate acyltransferase n=1 Tax=Candidatus Magnetoglobus multicellularis str. Araruama TaxID=890399 RepID=A0A1V1PGG0_9BACT|nr:MAG: Glycerol-3-phosphate O-acyltransferase [Candidatus Magnetoglobus multicellularis str. Araruama]
MKSSKSSRFARLRALVARIFQTACYLCFLPGYIGFVANKALQIFFSGIRVSPEQTQHLKSLQEKGHIVYTTKYKSTFDFLFYHSRYQKEGLPFPEIALDYKLIMWQPISRVLKAMMSWLYTVFQRWHRPNPFHTHYIRDEIKQGRCCFLSLLEPKGIYRRFVQEKVDPVQYLIEIQQSMDRPIYLVPQWILFSRKAHKSQRSFFEMLFGTEENPGNLRRMFMLLKRPENVFVESSEPFNLLRFIREPENHNRSVEHLSYLVRQEMINRLNRHRQSIVGPTLKTNEELKESILRNAEFQDFLEDYATQRKMPIQAIYRKADNYLTEIAAKYSNNMIQVFSWAVGWIANNMFEGFEYNQEMIPTLKQAAQKGPLILAPCHKSHIDYLILSYVMYHNNMPCPLIAAGKNLSFWPLGPIFRGGGAFFLRRSFRGAMLYSKVFAAYVNTVLKEGFNIEFFIEGGRSRTGKLNLAKLGLLSIILDAYKNGMCPDLMFVPIFIGYDKVIEEKAYISELEGHQKEPESLSQVIKARKFLSRRFGRIYVQFNEPISLKEILKNFDTPIQDMSSNEYQVLCRNIGHRLINSINEVTVVTPYALVASALLNCPLQGFTKSEFANRVETYLNYLVSINVKLSETLINYVQIVETVLETYANRKIIEKLEVSNVREALGDSRIRVNQSKRHQLDYYKNICICFFIPAAYTSLAILARDAFQFAEDDLYGTYDFLKEFFKNDFAYDADKTNQDYIQTCIKAFIDDAIVMPHSELPDVYNVTSVGYRKLGYFALFLKSYFQSYRIALDVFMENPQDKLDEKECIKKMYAMGNKLYKRSEIDQTESITKIIFKNAMKYYNYHDIKGKKCG